MTPEAKVGQGVDRLLQQAGWYVCDMAIRDLRRVMVNPTRHHVGRACMVLPQMVSKSTAYFQ